MNDNNVWVKWIHACNVHQESTMGSMYSSPKSASWATKYICKGRQDIMNCCWGNWLTITQYHTSDMYEQIHNNREKLHWCNDVWDHHNIPNTTSFLGWLCWMYRFQTRDKLVKFGVCEEDKCPMCENGKEEQHLLFECIYSRKCLKAVKSGWELNYVVVFVVCASL